MMTGLHPVNAGDGLTDVPLMDLDHALTPGG